MRELQSDDRCPCTSGLSFGECCGPLLSGERRAPTAQALMRSRFTAFAVGDPDYLLRTWYPQTRPATLDLDKETQWYRLDVLDISAGGPFDEVGGVTFVAFYRNDSGRHRMGERSRFVRQQGDWFYLDGEAV